MQEKEVENYKQFNRKFTDFFIGLGLEIFVLYFSFYDLDSNESNWFIFLLISFLFGFIFIFIKRKYIIFGMLMPIILILLFFGSCLLIIESGFIKISW